MLQKLASGRLAEALWLPERVHYVAFALAADTLPPERLREAATLAMLAGERDHAVTLLQRATRDPTDRGDGWFSLGLLAIAENRLTDALSCFDAAIVARFADSSDGVRLRQQIRNHSLEENRYYYFRYFYDFFANDFCMFVSFEKIGPFERQDYAFCFSRAIRYLGPRPAYRELLDRDLALNGPSPWHSIATGHIAWLAGDRDGADHAYRRARNLALQWRLTPYHFDCGILTWLTRSEAEILLQDKAPLGPMLPVDRFVFEDASIQPGAALVFVVGCDSLYLRFLPKFLASVLQAKRQSGVAAHVAVHCHLANPEPAQLTWLRQTADFLRTHAPDLSLGFSFCDATFKERAYYTCLRFLVLPQVMERYGCGVVAVDVDSTITSGFFTRLDDLNSVTFGLRAYTFPPDSRTQHNGEPWAIGAHPTYINSNEVGLRFARFLQRYLQVAYNPAWMTNWCIDQCAIGRGFDLMIREHPEISLLNFAHVANLYELPDDYGSKEAFLEAGGAITAETLPAVMHGILAEQAT